MLQQIETSRNDLEYIHKDIKEAQAKGEVTYFTEALGRSKSHITYHMKENAKEVERTNSRNKWVAELRKSLK